MNPEIVNFRNFRTDQINNYEINQEPIVLEPINVKFDAQWKGTLELDNVEKAITAFLMIKTTKLCGIIICESTNYLIRGNINTKSRSVNCSLYNIKEREEVNLSGRIDNNAEDTEYTIFFFFENILQKIKKKKKIGFVIICF